MLDISIHIFPPIFYVEDFDLPPRLNFYMSFEVFDIVKKIGLVPEKIHPSVS
jgi:hypothetical protein